MIFDKELMFIDGGNLQNATSVTSGFLDLGTEKAFFGRVVYLVVAPKSDLTATGNPDITLSLEFADTAAFGNSVTTAFPVLKKADFERGKVFCQPIPFVKGRFVRLKIAVSGTDGIACAELDAGIALDPEDPVTAD